MMGLLLPSLLRALRHAGRGFLLLLLLPQLLRRAGRGQLMLLLLPQVLRRAGQGLLLELQLQLMRRTGRGRVECMLLQFLLQQLSHAGRGLLEGVSQRRRGKVQRPMVRRRSTKKMQARYRHYQNAKPPLNHRQK